jgi:catechol 2,3-dioxygenase-like lactoylglutathione lyase family enzyme
MRKEKTMHVRHIGLACRDERNADRFYGGLLGLTKQERKTIPVSIAKPLFGLDQPLPVVNYSGAGLHVEVFLTAGAPEPAGSNGSAGSSGALADRLSHVCLEVEDAEALLARAKTLGFAVTRVPKGDGWVVFLEDADGHCFEIK